MTNEKYVRAAQEYLSRRAPGTKLGPIAEEIRPTSLEDALKVHEAMIELHDGKVGGWKCLLPPAEDKLIVAPIFADQVQTGDVCKLMMDKNKARIEPEIVFVLNKDLPAQDTDYSESEIDDAIGGCFMALELMQSRFDDNAEVDFSERLADCLLNQGLYLGPEIDRSKAFAAANINLSFKQGDSEQSIEGKHPNPLPQLPVYWLINFMSKRGVTFKKGEAITTGSYAGIVEVDFDKETNISYEGLGQYTVTFLQD